MARISRKQKKRIDKRRKILIILGSNLIFATLVFGIISVVFKEKSGIYDYFTTHVEMPTITQDFLTENPYSRPGIRLKDINGIVIHYTANPGTSAKNNRSYFEGLKDSKITYSSSHFIIGLKGEIIQCIPLDEIAYASNQRNEDTISIECCHPDADGKFNQKTYDSLVELVSWLCGEYNLSTKQVLRHYDVTKKVCPKYFVDYEDKWEQFKEDIKEYRKVHKIK